MGTVKTRTCDRSMLKRKNPVSKMHVQIGHGPATEMFQYNDSKQNVTLPGPITEMLH